MSRRVALPSFCLTCGYAEVPGEDFNAHECRDFAALSEPERKANERASWSETARRLRKQKVEVKP